MKSIDAKNWDPDIQRALTNAVAQGGAKFLLKNGQEIVAISPDLWAAVEARISPLEDLLRNLRDK
nr:hypothetical protein [uncultured Dongia sp.]